MASTILTSGGQKCELLYFDNMHINFYVFWITDHENEHSFNIYVIPSYKWPLQH